MEFRASAVAQVRERRGMVWEDGHSRAAEVKIYVWMFVSARK